MRQVVSTDQAPKAIGPYSQGVRAGQFVFLSGQVGFDPATGQLVPGGISEQTHRTLQNIGAILSAAGLSFDHVVKTTVFLADMSDFAANERRVCLVLRIARPGEIDYPGRASSQRRQG
jgi:2-iminobutanoate/2-iminopropanoate deaminase